MRVLLIALLAAISYAQTALELDALNDALISLPMASLAYAWRNILSDDPTATHDFKLLESQGGCVGNLNTANLEGEVHEDGDMFEKFAYILEMNCNGQIQMAVGFPGTETTDDIISDIASVISSSVNLGGQDYDAGLGFVEHFEYIFQDMSVKQGGTFEDLLQQRYEEISPDVVRVAGHSLGGALASLAAVHLHESDWCDVPIYLSTFGSPRVFAGTWFSATFTGTSSSDKAHEAFEEGNSSGNRHYRFVNSFDLVSSVPDTGFYHFGTPFQISTDSLDEESRDYDNSLLWTNHYVYKYLFRLEECRQSVYGNSITYRVSNNDYTGWRPSVVSIELFSDSACTSVISPAYLDESGNNDVEAYIAFYPLDETAWRPQCGTCDAGEAWVKFSTSEEVKCVIADNLGEGTAGGETWNGGILLEVKNDDGSWSTALSSDSGNTATANSDYTVLTVYTDVTCDNSQKISSECTSSSPCDADTCQEYCYEEATCAYYFLNVAGGCILYSDCASTRTPGYSGVTYQLIRTDVSCFNEGTNINTGCTGLITGACDDESTPVLDESATDLEGAIECQTLCKADSRCHCFTFVSASESSSWALTCFLRADCSSESSTSTRISGASTCSEETALAKAESLVAKAESHGREIFSAVDVKVPQNFMVYGLAVVGILALFHGILRFLCKHVEAKQTYDTILDEI